ncbi:MAG: hypothetical protein ABJ360_17735 [Roseobacter sp.]|uniref:helix-turn-helix transcriptional regulator n=1 Tax=Pseudomonadota TaxID=1224 RepID=UPI0032663391
MANKIEVEDLTIANEIINAQRNSIFNLSANHFGAVSEDDLCAQLGLPRTTYTQLKAEGKGPEVFKLGRRNYVHVEHVREWLRRMAGIQVAA